MIEIVVSRFGDTVVLDNGQDDTDATVLQPIDGKGLKCGKHKFCGNSVEIRNISEHFNAMVCNQCSLRAPFWNKNNRGGQLTIDDIVEYFQSQFSGT